MQEAEKYMMRCLELAKAGKSLVAPNPMVGAVIVHKGQIIGEGFHRQYGGAHAEVNAIQAVHDETLLRNSTLYVNLEPCAHTGKTPPCTGFILQKKIPKVVVGCLDPSPKVSGKGVKQLRNAGVEVVMDVMKKEATELNRFFITAHTKQRPYIILKWAQSSDGYIDRLRRLTFNVQRSKLVLSEVEVFNVHGSGTDDFEKPFQFSTPASRRHVHKLRSEVSAIMVGTNTVLLDNPSLTVRHWIGNSPVRIFIDRTLRIPESCHLLDGSVKTIVFTEFKIQDSRFNVQDSTFNSQFSILNSQFSNVEYIGLDFSKPIIPQLLQILYERKLFSLLVEGGAILHRSFLDAGLWDEIQIETSPVKLGNGVKAPVNELDEIAECQKIIQFSTENLTKKDISDISVYVCRNL